MTTRTTAWAGIDIGKTHHWICAVDADGRALVSVKVANVEADIVAALATVTDLADAGGVGGRHHRRSVGADLGVAGSGRAARCSTPPGGW